MKRFAYMLVFVMLLIPAMALAVTEGARLARKREDRQSEALRLRAGVDRG